MNQKIIIATAISIIIGFNSCTEEVLELKKGQLKIVNREILTDDGDILALNAEEGDGLAILKNIKFRVGTIELDLKGENNPGKSFIGLAFNIQNDSTYEAIYFRPFNFKSKEAVRREHSVQYVSHPNHTWKFLRDHHQGIYEAEYPKPPAPDDWFKIRLDIDNDQVRVLDKMYNRELLIINRLEKQSSDKIGLWVGNYSTGEFKNLMLIE